MKKTIKHPETAQVWKDNFRNFSMRIGFTLSLSRAMLEMICAVADDVQWDRGLYHQGASCPENFLASMHSLVKRGLIQRKPEEEIQNHRHHTSEFSGEWTHMELTPAGKLVVSLLKTVGMFIESDAAINKRSRRA